jgi:hypothetical protein
MYPFIWIVLFYPYFCTPQKGKRSDSVAQLVEQYTFNVWALGSSPSGITKLRRKSGLFCFKTATGACSRKQSRNKKAKATHRVALRSFGLDQFGGEVGAEKRSRQSHIETSMLD